MLFGSRMRGLQNVVGFFVVPGIPFKPLGPHWVNTGFPNELTKGMLSPERCRGKDGLCGFHEENTLCNQRPAPLKPDCLRAEWDWRLLPESHGPQIPTTARARATEKKKAMQSGLCITPAANTTGGHSDC